MCLGGNIIDPGQGPVYCNDQYGGNPVPALQTPGVEFADGGTSLNPCDLLEQESMDVRKQYCAGCHAPGGDPLAPFHTILEDNYANGGGMTTPDGGTTLFGTIRKNSAPPAPIIIPGDHANSYLYQRVAGNTMPPVTVTVRPNVSDIALLGAWIDNLTSCFNQLGGGGGGGDAGGDDGGGGSGDGGAD